MQVRSDGADSVYFHRARRLLIRSILSCFTFIVGVISLCVYIQSVTRRPPQGPRCLWRRRLPEAADPSSGDPHGPYVSQVAGQGGLPGAAAQAHGGLEERCSGSHALP